MDLVKLAKEMMRRNALGFGVETIDVAYALQWERRVILKHKDEIRAFGEPDLVMINENGIRLLQDLKLITPN